MKQNAEVDCQDLAGGLEAVVVGATGLVEKGELLLQLPL